MDRKSKKKFKIVALGCRTNQYEAQAYRDQLVEMGYEQANDGENADLCIVNTCTVTESADSSSRHEIRQMARQNPGARLAVTGCSVERQPEKIQSISGVTDLIPNANKETLLQELFPEDSIPEFSIKNFDAHTRAFLKVQDGCNSYCTYCIIPYVRGRSRSRTIVEIVKEAEDLVRNGFKEIVLTGINIGDFDGNQPKEATPDKLSDLVRAVDRIDGLERLRVSSIDPDEVDDELMDAILNGKRTCHSMHVVLQSGSNVILKRMNRKYTRQIFMETVEKLRRACPDFTFTTDVIVGFPGETDLDFNDTLEVMQEVQFAKVHMFPYSPRPRTRAAMYPNRVPSEVIAERKQKVLRMSEQIALDLRQKFVGRTMLVLTEEMNPDHTRISGHTENFLNVHIEGKGLQPNQVLEVELRENTPEGLLGFLAKSNVSG
jgi:threonylcarbamoyladenosine tRNA methylthiotransferase MtaB